MSNSYPKPSTAISRVSGTLLSLLLLASPAVVLAHGGHGDEFQGPNQATQTTGSIQVDAETAKRLGIKVEPVKRQRLAVGIKTTGQIETLPSQKVEVTTPITGAKVVELLVEPGATVKKSQPVAVVTSPDLVTLRVESQEKLAQAQADLQQAQADLRLAQQNYDRYQQIADSEIAQAQSQVSFAQEKYDKDKQLADAGALPRRNALESQTQLAEAKAELTKAKSRRDVIEAENQLKRAQAAVNVAQSRINLSNTTYQTRLQQLGNSANAKGLVTVTAPISGKVADREVTIGQTFNDAGGKLMTIVNDSRLFATANIYEKDLGKVRNGQRISLKVASMPERNFSGRISRIGTVVEGETRVVPVQAEINNTGGQLKPGMFAELEVLTDQTSAAMAIPTSAVVDANGKKVVYVQNGNAFQAAEVSLGQTSGDMVEVKSGLFEGDMIVTQRAPQLYAQSLRGDTKQKVDEHTQAPSQTTDVKTSSLPVPLWLLGVGGGAAIATIAFIGGAFWSGRRSKLQQLVLVGSSSELDAPVHETESYHNNSKSPALSGSTTNINEHEDPHYPQS
ncbi:efflux RND transporter periplasmic adaptor subunit [Fischerella thermalis CCMEE 5273]|uniref:Nickel-cobalt resistance protein n=1 Tax=Chlorogloeopsis fritschii PCC 6912 TaxID=211165 RepID=A0A3S0Y295_CHLFR|nr:efflux RND transporter periplasmic adaptor subunit [Chlorogloeopsis fritschii]PMB02215.1 efflux RND transporter periplasmic adaptor subunit [Fischerella thermalis CCMEE 5273]RUR83742.1 nickel-cobalt resistance protein [Chlorogloeopsis fritschii PCC 6912]